MATLLRALSLLALLPLLGCPLVDRGLGDDDDSSPSLDDLVAIKCQQIEDCYGLAPQTMQECIDEYTGWRNDDLDRMNDTCDDALFDLMECEYNLSCDDFYVFVDGPSDGEPCFAEFEAFHFEHDCMAGAE